MKHDFNTGDQIVLAYAYEQYAYPGSVAKVTPTSVHLKLTGEDDESRFFFRNGSWRSEFGRAVSILATNKATKEQN